MSFNQNYFFPTQIVNITSLNGGVFGIVKATDVYPAVDTTDVTQSTAGTTKPYQIVQLLNFMFANFGFIVYAPVLAASISSLMATYNNGAAGVGATLTNSGIQTAFSLDGQAGIKDGRYLVKNQFNPAQNGIYTLTVVGDNATNWVLTRAVDFNSSSNIINNGLVYVLYGSTNANFIEQDSFSGSLTVGTTAINYSRFVLNIDISGTVNPGLANELAYYTVNGNIVDGLPTANNGTLVTSNVGVPSISSTLPSAVQNNITALGAQSQALNMNSHLIDNVTDPVSAQDAATKNYVDTQDGNFAHKGANSDITSMSGLTGYLQAPLGVKDSNGNIVLSFNNVASAVNYLKLFNNATGLPVVLEAAGSDPSINIILATKDGDLLLQDLAFTKSPILKFFNAATTHFTGLSVATAQSTDLALTLPALDGTANAPMITDGSGHLSFLPGAWVDFSGTVGATGLTAAPTVVTAKYKIIGKTCFLNFNLGGTSNATTFSITNLPFTAAQTTWVNFLVCTNNSVSDICSGIISGTTLTLYYGTGSNISGWTNAGSKDLNATLFYETT